MTTDLAERDQFIVSRAVVHTLEIVRQWYQERHSGGCRILSLGDACPCFLCLCDAMIAKENKEHTHEMRP